jgi:hypothetical protein
LSRHQRPGAKTIISFENRPTARPNPVRQRANGTSNAHANLPNGPLGRNLSYAFQCNITPCTRSATPHQAAHNLSRAQQTLCPPRQGRHLFASAVPRTLGVARFAPAAARKCRDESRPGKLKSLRHHDADATSIPRHLNPERRDLLPLLASHSLSCLSDCAITHSRRLESGWPLR